VAIAQHADDLVPLKRRLLLWAVGTLLGIAWCVAVDQTSGGWLVTASFAMLVLTLHRFGRTGPG